MLTAVVKAAVINAIIDTGTFIGDIMDITNITIYLQNNDTTDTTNTIHSLPLSSPVLV